VQTFQAQISANGPVTVTDPEVRRYFMTIEEAIQLVIQAGAVGSSSEALVLDMGEPVKIVEVARRMIAQAGAQIEVVFTGLRPGEKLNEVLFDLNEPDRRPHHPLISHVDVPPLHPGRVPLLDPFAPGFDLISRLRTLCRSSGMRAYDKADALEITSIEFDPAISEALLTINSGRTPRVSAYSSDSSPVDPNGKRRCNDHRRWSDRDAISSCPTCGDVVDEAGEVVGMPRASDLAVT
ncbi:MAG: polysaccharide biosynthesis protein, partial [Acidimicrobiales bacterium]